MANPPTFRTCRSGAAKSGYTALGDQAGSMCERGKMVRSGCGCMHALHLLAHLWKV